MTDPLTLTAGALITLATQEFVKAGTGELAKKFTGEAIAKIPELWGQIKTKLSGKSAKVDEALVNVEKDDQTGGLGECYGKKDRGGVGGNGRSRVCDSRGTCFSFWRCCMSEQIHQTGLENVSVNGNS